MQSHLTLQDIKFIKTQKSPVLENKFVYIFDSKYNLPKSSIYILLKYPDLFSNLLTYSKYFKLKEEVFYMRHDTLLTDCMVQISVNMTENGVEIHIHGISTRMKDICKLFINFLFEDTGNEREELVIDQIKKNLSQDKFAQSYKRLFQGLKLMFIEGYRMSEDMLENLVFDKELTVKKCNHNLCIVGNISLDDAREVQNILISNIENIEEISNNSSSYKLEEDSLTVKTFDIKNNACGVYFYTNTFYNLYKKAISSFIVNTVQEMFFDQLRTNEEFGYVVCADTYRILNKEFIYFVVQSEKDVITIKERILKFIEFAKEYISNMTEEEFNDRKEALIDEYNETHKNINSYSYYLYSKFIYEIDGLKYKENMINFIDQMTLKDVQNNNVFGEMYVIETLR